MNDNLSMFIMSKFRQRLKKLEANFGKNYTIITLGYSYEVAFKDGADNNEDTKLFKQ